MVKNKAQQYLENQILTAAREQLLIMLFDGAIRFSEQAKIKIDENNTAESCKLLIKAQKIMIELISSLNKNAIEEELYNNIIRLYNFIYFRLIKANMTRDKALIDDAIAILKILRSAWAEAVEKDKQSKFPQAVLVNQAVQEVKSISA